MTKENLVQKSFEFVNEPKKKTTLFQKIILGVILSAPIALVGGKYEIERMNRGYEQMERNIKGAFLRAITTPVTDDVKKQVEKDYFSEDNNYDN